MQFQFWQCNFNFGNAISNLAMQLQFWQCNCNFGNAISNLAVQLQFGGVKLRGGWVGGGFKACTTDRAEIPKTAKAEISPVVHAM
jgi:hypothetical protein